MLLTRHFPSKGHAIKSATGHIHVTWSVHVLCIQISDYFSGTAKCIRNFINRSHIPRQGSYNIILVKYCIALMQSRLQVNISEFSSICYLEFMHWQHGKCKITKLFWLVALIKKYKQIVISVNSSYNVRNFCSQYVIIMLKGLASVNWMNKYVMP